MPIERPRPDFCECNITKIGVRERPENETGCQGFSRLLRVCSFSSKFQEKIHGANGEQSSCLSILYLWGDVFSGCMPGRAGSPSRRSGPAVSIDLWTSVINCPSVQLSPVIQLATLRPEI